MTMNCSNNVHSTTSNTHEEGSIIDRTIHPTFPTPHPVTTPSTQSSSPISPKTELLHRLNGTSILSQTTALLRLSPNTFATSTTIFHRFYHRKSLTDYDVWSTCLGCVILACKVEEEVRRVSEVILVFVHVYRRMRFAMGCDLSDETYIGVKSNSDDSKEFQTAYCPLLESSITSKDKQILSQEERQNILRYIYPLPRNGPIYKEWEEELMNMENVILRELGFSLYWIPDSHPHVFLLYFMKVLDLVNNDVVSNNVIDGDHHNNQQESEMDDKKIMSQIAWNYCNDSCRLDLCVRYEAELIVSDVHLVLHWLDESDYLLNMVHFYLLFELFNYLIYLFRRVQQFS